MAERILILDRLTKNYGKLKAVDNLSFTIEKGNIYGILGPNGSGKSTTLGMVLNVVNPSSGNFRWFESDMPTHDALKKIGAIIENPNFYPNMSAYENLKLVCKIKELNESSIDDKLEVVGLLDRKNDHFKQYSLGMKQRLAIASALLNDPEILILDEPTNGLDPAGIHQIRDIITRIANQGTTILLASHLLDEVEKICTHVVILREGKNLYTGRVDEMNATHGFVEVAADDPAKVKAFLESCEEVSKVKELPKGVMKAMLNQPTDAATINKKAAKEQLFFNHLIKRKESLEDSFLEITKN